MPKMNVLHERYVFYNRNQIEGELFDTFYADVGRLVQSCKLMCDVVRDRLMFGTIHQELQNQLIRMSTPTLDNIVSKSRLCEKNEEYTK